MHFIQRSISRTFLFCLVLPLALGLSGCQNVTAGTSTEAVSTEVVGTATSDIEQTLDDLHKLAAAADFDGYFALYAPYAVFMGTDRTEYWPLKEFKAYTKPRFTNGIGWTYVPTARKIHLNGATAWFEERLQNKKYGEVRGTGVLVRTESGWKVAQYNLALPLPNELFGDIAQRVIEYYSEP